LKTTTASPHNNGAQKCGIEMEYELWKQLQKKEMHILVNEGTNEIIEGQIRSDPKTNIRKPIIRRYKDRKNAKTQVLHSQAF